MPCPRITNAINTPCDMVYPSKFSESLDFFPCATGGLFRLLDPDIVRVGLNDGLVGRR